MTDIWLYEQFLHPRFPAIILFSDYKIYKQAFRYDLFIYDKYVAAVEEEVKIQSNIGEIFWNLYNIHNNYYIK